jgi:RecG-like helicase
MSAPRPAPMMEAKLRERIWVAGRIRALRGKTDNDASNLECEITDGTGSLLLVFQGRRRIPGIAVGARLVAEGMVGSWRRRLAILNPDYELLGDSLA